jgi:tRNA dimethylallyltransferase
VPKAVGFGCSVSLFPFHFYLLLVFRFSVNSVVQGFRLTMLKRSLYYAAMKRPRKIPVVIGPTCVGKTAFSVELALAIDAEIISCDSRQVYVGMDIGTAKTPYHLQQIVRHHLIDMVYPDEKYNAQLWAEQSESVIDDIHERKKMPLIVCGTGLYLAALTEGFFPLPRRSERRKRAIAERIHDIEQKQSIHDYLSSIDAESAERIHPHDLYRIRRAVEIYLLTKKPLSVHRRQTHKKRNLKYVFVGLTMERDLLYLRIDQRVEEMVERGFIQEVRQLLVNGYSRDLGAFHAPGYNEFIKYTCGELSRDAAIEETKVKTRNYAKRQFTWFKKIDEAHWLDVTDGYGERICEAVQIISTGRSR